MSENQTPDPEQEKKPETALTIKDEQNPLVQVFDLSSQQFNELNGQQLKEAMDNAKALPIDLVPGYWDPQNIGETKKLLLDKIVMDRYADKQDPDAEVELETVYFSEVKEDGTICTVKNASWKLAKAMRGYKRGSLFLIIFNGRIKNRGNDRTSSSWIIKPLILKIEDLANRTAPEGPQS